MLISLILITIPLFTESFGQNDINCSILIGYNRSILGVVSNPTRNGYSVPVKGFASFYPNGTSLEYAWSENGGNVYQGTGVYNISRSSNANVECYMYVAYTNGPLNDTTSCYAYSVTTNPLGTVGCKDTASAICPSSCSPQYVLQNNHSWFGALQLNSVSDVKSITHRKIDHKAGSNCDAFIGYNTSVIGSNLIFNPYPHLYYYSLYNNGSLVSRLYNQAYFGAAVYNVSQSSSPDVECVIHISWQDGIAQGENWCMSYAMNANGTGAVGCLSYNQTCPSSCSSDYAFANGNAWTTSLRLNLLS